MWTRRLVAAGAILTLTIAAAPAFAACDMGLIAGMRTTMSDGLPLVGVKVGDAELALQLASGDTFTEIKRAKVEALKLKTGPSDAGWRDRQGRVNSLVRQANIPVLSIGGKPFTNLRVLVSILDRWREEPDGGPGDGRLGQDILGISDVDYNLSAGVVRWIGLRDCAKADLAYWAQGMPHSVVDFTLRKLGPTRVELQYPTSEAFINGVRVRVLFDTSTRSSVVSSSFAARAGVTPGGPGVLPDGVIDEGPKVDKFWKAPFSSFKIGGEEFHDVTLRLTDGGLAEDDQIDMIIGADFFLTHHVYVANSQRKIYFTHNGGAAFVPPEKDYPSPKH